MGGIKITQLNRDHISCPYCSSPNIIKKGFYYNPKRKTRCQRFYCQNCKHKFASLKKERVDEANFKYQDQALPARNWSALNIAQQNERNKTMELLHELLSEIQILKNPYKKGRKAYNPKDVVFCLALKQMNKISSRRLASDIVHAKEQGYIETLPYFTTILEHLKKPEIQELIEELIRLSALPIKELNESLICAVDATGMSLTHFTGWMETKHKVERKRNIRDWVKLHAMVDTYSNVFTNVQVTLGRTGDSPIFETLFNNSAKDFKIKELSGDKAYTSRKNFEIINSAGAKPFLLFRKGDTPKSRGCLTWMKYFLYLKENPQEYLQHYHKRSNVESAFSMLKKRFGDTLFTKNLQSQKSEVLLRVLLHNLSCIVRQCYENGLIPNYTTEAHKVKVRIN